MVRSLNGLSTSSVRSLNGLNVDTITGDLPILITNRNITIDISPLDTATLALSDNILVQQGSLLKKTTFTDIKTVEDNDRNLDPHIKTHHDAFRNFLSLSSKKNPMNVTRKQPARPGLGETDKG